MLLEKQVDLTELFLKFQEKHRNVFMQKLDSQVFIYRSLGRKEYKDILKDERFSDAEKEDLICEICILWPENYDLDNCEAGIPSVLTKMILENSFLDKLESRKTVMSYYRQEMFDLDNQVSCIINEAFPNHDIEDIESWDIEKTMKYLSRAEWKLHNLRGLEFYDPDSQESFYENTEPQTEEVEDPEEKPLTNKKKENNRGGAKEKMTPEKLAELAEMRRKFPEINWDADTVMHEGDIVPETIDTVAPALRPGWKQS